MNPARAMGTFLRTWRAEWAGLSRAQLAIAVSAECANGKRLKPGVIRWWEDGQPPTSTAELDGLLKVMRRHGLTVPEVEQYRQAVFAACLDRQYPQLLGGEDIAQRPDVEELTESFAQRAAANSYYPEAVNVVGLVAWRTELETAVAAHQGSAAGGAQWRRQRGALAWVREVATDYHRARGRWALAGPDSRATAALLRDMGRDGHAERFDVMADEGDFLSHYTARGAWRMVEWHHKLWDRGDKVSAADRLSVAMMFAHLLPDVALHEALRSMADRHLPVLEHESHRPILAHGHRACFYMDLADRRPRDAERHLAHIALADKVAPAPDRLTDYCLPVGRFAMVCGRFAEAQSCFEEALSLAVKYGWGDYEIGAHGDLQACGRAQRAARDGRVRVGKPGELPWR